MIFPQPPLQEDPISGSLPWVNWFSTAQKYFKSLADTVAANTANITTLMASPSWQTPTLATNWSNYGAPWQTARYYKDSLGIVHLEGLVKKSTAIVAGEVIFTLPSGYLPSNAIIFAVDSGASHGRCDVMSDGRVVVTVGNAGYFSLSGITFKAA